MKAMVLNEIKKPLILEEVPKPTPLENEVLIRVHTCGVCRTDLHIIDGELPTPSLPLILGHQIVGYIEKVGEGVSEMEVGKRVGVPWLGGSCGKCSYCLSDQENLCDAAIYTGYQRGGGFAEYCIADFRFVFPLPDNYSDGEIAPFLCGGFIGFRAFKMTGDAKKIGFYGFGASAHLLIQLLRYQNKEVYVFTRPQDQSGQAFAKSLGATWVGPSNDSPPVLLDAAILFAPLGELVPLALKAVRKGGIVVCAGIHMSDIPSFPYYLLWEERVLRSVANLTRQDGKEFLSLVLHMPIHSAVTFYPLEKANDALDDLRHGRFSGAAVIII